MCAQKIKQKVTENVCEKVLHADVYPFLFPQHPLLTFSEKEEQNNLS